MLGRLTVSLNGKKLPLGITAAVLVQAGALLWGTADAWNSVNNKLDTLQRTLSRIEKLANEAEQQSRQNAQEIAVLKRRIANIEEEQ